MVIRGHSPSVALGMRTAIRGLEKLARLNAVGEILLNSSSGTLSQDWTESPIYGATRLDGALVAAASQDDVAHKPKRGRFASAERDVVYRRALAIADATAAAGAALLAFLVVGQQRTSVAIFGAIPLIVLMSKALGTYNREDLLVRKSTLDEGPALFQLATFFSLVAWLIDGLVVSGYRNRVELAVIWASSFLLLLVLRTAARWFSRRITAPERCLVIGDDASCAWMQLKFARRRSLHAVVVARIVPSEPGTSMPADLDAEELRQVVAPLGVDRIIVTPDTSDEDGVIGIVHAATSLGLKVSVLPRVLQVVGSSSQFDDVEGVPLLSLRPLGSDEVPASQNVSSDIVGSSLCMLFLAPVLSLIAVLIKLDSRGPVLFRQDRIGRDGKRVSDAQVPHDGPGCRRAQG